MYHSRWIQNTHVRWARAGLRLDARPLTTGEDREKVPWGADGVREGNLGGAIAAGKVEPLGIHARGEPRPPR